MEFDKDFLGALFEQAVGSPRRRQVCDLRTSPQDTGQRALCALLPGTQVPIHRHEETAEYQHCSFRQLGRCQSIYCVERVTGLAPRFHVYIKNIY